MISSIRFVVNNNCSSFVNENLSINLFNNNCLQFVNFILLSKSFDILIRLSFSNFIDLNLSFTFKQLSFILIAVS